MWSQSHYRSLAPGRGEIQISIARLADRYPFHVRVLEQLDIRPAPGLTTMGVTASDDGVTLLYNPEVVKQITFDELGGLLLHLVNHLVAQFEEMI